MNTTETVGQIGPVLDKVPYPSGPLMKTMYKTPLLLWRLGLGPLLGQLFLILTTRGRKSGLARHTPVEYFEFNGRLHVMAAWPKSDWYRNLMADPHVTVQTASGTQSALARRLASDAEFLEMYDYIEAHPAKRRIWEAMGLNITRESFLAEKEGYYLIRFEPTAEPTPEPLPVDLRWVWLLLPAVFWLLRRLTAPGRKPH